MKTKLMKRYNNVYSIVSSDIDNAKAREVIEADIAKCGYLAITLRRMPQRGNRVYYLTGYANLQYILE